MSMISQAMLGATTLIIAISALAHLVADGVHHVGRLEREQARLSMRQRASAMRSCQTD